MSKNFDENSTVKKLWKGSHFKNLFEGRNNLLSSGYPGVGKGLEFNDPTLNFKGGNYTFKVNNGEGTMTCKNGSATMTAVQKKGGRFDVTCKDKLSNEMTGFVKYEGGNGAPNYVTGVDYADGDIKGNAKYNFATGWMKSSATMRIDGGFQAAAEMKMQPGGASPQVHAGATFASQLGVTGAAIDDKMNATVNHYCDIDPDKSVCAEMCMSLDGRGKAPQMWLGAGWRLDNDHHMKMRMRDNLDANFCLKKSFAPGMGLSLGYIMNLQNPNLNAPQFGFKVDAKM